MKAIQITYTNNGAIEIVKDNAAALSKVSRHYYPQCEDMICRAGSDDEVVSVYHPDKRNSFEGAYLEQVECCVKTQDINGIHPDHTPRILALVVIDDTKYMAVQTADHAIMPNTWNNPVVARIPMDWTMGKLMSSGYGVCEPVWSLAACGYAGDIVTDETEIRKVVSAIEELPEE